ncbi:hypothetical protein E4U54_004177 [Claviceps lovelessii]|nr:hypothetical protein E4U54_004177 [Claviceps lovelessii]
MIRQDPIASHLHASVPVHNDNDASPESRIPNPGHDAFERIYPSLAGFSKRHSQTGDNFSSFVPHVASANVVSDLTTHLWIHHVLT